MDPEQLSVFLLSKNKELERENGQLRSMLRQNEEKTEPKPRAHRDAAREELPGCSSSGRTPCCSLGEKTNDERNFRKNLQLQRVKNEHRTSSPIDFKSFLMSSMNIDHCERAESQSCKVDLSPSVKDEMRLLGEVAFQLDKRILSHIFQGNKRHYGFTLMNIPDKITEVSTHLLTGKVDEGYRLYLTQRYSDLMERLGRLGYRKALHPVFTEFVVNTFGILKEKPDEHSLYHDAEFLKTAIMTIAPGKLQKDLMLVHTCLCDMAQRDGDHLLLW